MSEYVHVFVCLCVWEKERECVFVCVLSFCMWVCVFMCVHVCFCKSVHVNLSALVCSYECVYSSLSPYLSSLLSLSLFSFFPFHPAHFPPPLSSRLRVFMRVNRVIRLIGPLGFQRSLGSLWWSGLLDWLGLLRSLSLCPVIVIMRLVGDIKGFQGYCDYRSY